MATIGHLAVAALIARASTRASDSRDLRLRRFATLAAWTVAPDLDLVLRAFGVPRGDRPLGHRGAMHALVIGPIVGSLLWLARMEHRDAASIGLALASHGLTDILSDSERGVALAWPFSSRRFLARWRPVPSIPLNPEDVLSGSALRSIVREAVVFAPLGILVLWPGPRALYADGP